MSSSSIVLECHEVSKVVSNQEESLTILDKISFQVTRAESVAIIGKSGSGKTTLLSLLAGLDVPEKGSIRLFGNNLESLDEDDRAGLRNEYTGFVFQSFHLLPGFTALENVMLPLEINGDENARQKAVSFLERVGMEHRLDHYPATLSGGEQQRVAIARAFACNPPLLLADEPTGNLDTETGQQVMDLLFELNRENDTTLVLVTHDSELAARCDRCLKLSAGRLQDD